MGTLYQTGDWKQEKHVPVIEGPASVKNGTAATYTLSIGKGVAHPNTTAHHIAWFELYFLPDGEKFPYQLARCDFTAHGASPQGPDTSTVSTAPSAAVTFSTGKSGTLIATSCCNIHGLWESSQRVTVE